MSGSSSAPARKLLGGSAIDSVREVPAISPHSKIAAAELRPVIDRSFAFEEAPEAYRTMQAAGHFGKLVIEL